MRHLNLPSDPASPLKILCLGAHADDIEIGCGGTILQLASQYANCIFHWVVFSANGIRAKEAEQAASLFAGSTAIRGPQIKNFKDGFMPYMGGEVKAAFEELKQVSPDLIFTHNRHDAHQDHRLLAELTWNTFRDHLILEYEIPKYDGDMGQPSIFVPLDAATCKKEGRFDHGSLPVSARKALVPARDVLLPDAAARNGVQSPSGYAEAFYGRKMRLHIGT